jgi:hypothetical protein
MSKFHQNMIALMREWYPKRNMLLIRDTLAAIYSFEGYNPRDEPTEVQRENIAHHLVTYRVG